MTDITELAHGNSLRKKLNRRLNDAYGFQRTSGGKHTTISLSIAECKSVIAALDERLALAEALEKAQQRIGKLEKKITDHKRMNQEMAKAMLTPNDSDAAGMEIAALRQRIAELESRTVKLPDLRQIVSGDRYVWSDGVYNYSQDVKVTLAAAGIKVEAE
ncbi:ead/Ea22-like family protein [Klebsiella pneumoniae]